MTEEKALTKLNSGQLAKPIDFILPESIGDFNVQDLRLSNIFICQDQSNKARDKGIIPGTLYDSLTFNQYDKLNVIICFSFTTRILYGEKIGDSILCYSQDGKVPSSPSPVNNDCISCIENIRPATMIKKGESKYGRCNRTFNFACIEPGIEEGNEKDFPFIISMQRTNAITAKTILNMAFRKRQELYSVVRTISTKQVHDEKYRYYTFVIDDNERTLEQDILRSKYWLQFMKAMHKAQKLIIDSSGIEENEIQNNIVEGEDLPF